VRGVTAREDERFIRGTMYNDKIVETFPNILGSEVLSY
jgi:hypothetical protein